MSSFDTGPAGLVSRPVAECTSSEVAAAVNRAFEEYVVPVRVSARSYERRFRGEDLDPFASRVYEHGGEPAGVLLVGRRGWTARVAGMGLAPGLRGRGLGRRVMRRAVEDARLRGDRAVVLEVFEQNERAAALYASLGFRPVRRLVGWRRRPADRAAEDGASLAVVDPLELARVVAREGAPDLPWMLAAETLSSAVAPARAFTLEGRAYALVADTAAEALVLSALVVPLPFRRQGWGARMLGALGAAFPGRSWSVLQVVPDDLAPGFMERGGWERHPLDQLEMRLELG